MFRGLSHIFLFSAGQMYEVSDLQLVYNTNYKLIFARGIVSALAISTAIFCIQIIPLSIYGLIFELAPVFALVLSAIVLQECMPPLEIFLGAVAILGVVLVVQPPFEFLGFTQNEGNLTIYQYWVSLLAIVVPALVSAALVLLRKMGTKNNPVPVTVTAFAVGCSVFAVGLIFHLATEGFTILNCVSTLQLFYLISIGVLAFINQFVMYFANKYEKVPIISLILTGKVPTFFVIDFILFPNDVQSYNYIHYIGGVTVFSAIVALLISNYFKIGKQLHNSCKQKLLESKNAVPTESVNCN